MIRWGRLTLLLTPIVLIWAGTHFFLDRGIRTAIQSAGTSAVGARVDVAGVRTSFWGLSAVVRGVAVTDPELPMTNAVEIGTVRLKLQLKPLFWKKVVVERAEILNIRTGTPRRTSGALPEKVKSPAQTEEPSALAETAKGLSSSALGNLKNAYDPQKLVSTENLLSYRKAMAEQQRLTQLADSWKSRTQNLGEKDLSRRAQEFADKVKNGTFSGVEGIAKAQSLLKEGQALRKDLSAAQNDIKSLGSELPREVAEAKATLKEIDRLRRQDIDAAVAQAKSGLSAEGVTKGLLGPAWFSKLEKSLGWIEKVRSLGGGDKEKRPPPASEMVRTGRDVSFPFHHRWPAFHLDRATLSGQTPGGLNYEGTLSDVSSDPKLLGRPSLLELSGRSGERALRLFAALDMTTTIPEETIDADVRGIPLSGLALGSLGGGPVSIADGRGTVRAKIHVRGDGLNGAIDLDASGVALNSPSAEKTDRVNAALDNVLKGITEAKIGISVSGTLQAPRFALTSSLDKQLGGALKSVLDKETAQLRADLEKRISGVVGQETEKLTALIEKSAGPALEKLNVSDKNLSDVQEKIKKALDGLAGSGAKSLKVPDLKNLFKKR